MIHRQFTATVFVFHDKKVLLHYHAKLRKWLPPGGHIEPNETPPEAARREVLEETGLEIVFIDQEILKIPISFERPFICLLEDVPAHKDTPAHQHMDFIYLAKPVHGHMPYEGFHWFSKNQLKDLELFADTTEILNSPAIVMFF